MTQPKSEGLLAQVVASAQADEVDFALLQALIMDASEAGACRALTTLGLDDGWERRDMDELRELLVTWRDMKRSAWQSVTRWAVRVLLALIMIGVAYQSDLRSLLKG